MSRTVRPNPVARSARPRRIAGSPGATLALVSLLFIASAATVSFAQAQNTASPHTRAARPSISGRVIDAETGLPLRTVQVSISAALSDHLDEISDGGTDSAGRYRIVLTDPAGEYSFPDLHPGRFRVYAQTPGYRGTTVDVDLSTGGTARITLGLELAPVALPAIHVTGILPQPFGATRARDADQRIARRIVVLGRQEDYLETDVRSITAGDVQDAVTLAEPDLFRAIQRMPGVTRRDDYTAVLWTRGAPWVQTRVYFDGMPLYNPTHGGWLFSSINPDGIGSAIFQPGVRSVAIGEGAAGVLDLESRHSAGDAWLNMNSEMSLASAKLSADGRLPGGATWLVAARRTYIDLLTNAWERFTENPDVHVPYDFSDLIARVDVPLPGGLSIHASSLAERDRLRGDIPDFLQNNRAKWGNQVNQVTAKFRFGSAVLSGSVGGTRFQANIDQATGIDGDGAEETDEPTLSELQNTISHDRFSIRLDGAPLTAGGLGWGFGFERIKERLAYEGPFSLTGEGIPGLPISPYTLAMANAYDAGWAEFRFAPIRSLDLQGGVRVETGDSLRNGGETRVSPRFSIRWVPTRSTTVSAGWGRSFQYSQAIGASGGPLGPQLHIGNLWILSNIGFPALRSNIHVVGAEHWISGDWLLTGNAYHRVVDGVAEPDPTPGVIRPDAVFFAAEQVAQGIEVSARKLADDWTMMLGYAYGEATTEVLDFKYPSQGDVRHTVDATAGYRFPNGLRIGAAFAYSTGVPYTRVLIADVPALGEPNARRTPSYIGFDMVLNYAKTIGQWEVELYAQLLNVFNRANRITYSGSRCQEEWTTAFKVGECSQLGVFDELKAGLPRLPLFGIRVGF